MSRILRGLTEHSVETHPASEDPRLAGRTYAIPFEDVWQASWRLTGGGLPRWRMLKADDQTGVILAHAKALMLPIEVDMRVNIRLDENAQTRVDLSAVGRKQRGDLGFGRRAIGRFTSRLDRELNAQPKQILDPTRTPAWLDSA